MKKYIITPRKQTKISDLISVANGNLNFILSKKTKNSLKKSRELMENKSNSGEMVYGINTSFGELKYQPINRKNIEQLQKNLNLEKIAAIELI